MELTWSIRWFMVEFFEHFSPIYQLCTTGVGFTEPLEGLVVGYGDVGPFNIGGEILKGPDIAQAIAIGDRIVVFAILRARLAQAITCSLFSCICDRTSLMAKRDTSVYRRSSRL